ncbi:bifunctional 3-demethylubiquinone-9 3-methyltransferase/ 2-octaprenyl-6-hydroxy phenol methylase [Nocardioides dokdonensis FR1436]|uniref:Bifunctional 3-demethylubiquinone-9 3-methyltransferase/ 2-octaprenyl-6-hydroxy phenol methylase n=1 Tax=Nocardioides dokdonensis FR1436 TaxID=1300347 RepID=A0A1A9GN93_9ACTN|nr:PIG-L family deacetylase [Nocardioides dokdonensis]ANH39754.1 bifunctional 3-demethylubiquinone-9 3-methyltransferase/ 2-octaprenyl-6-hydroxy phenol methylase [Nocardioides dokdonensis FR1436]
MSPSFRHDSSGTAARTWHDDRRWAALPMLELSARDGRTLTRVVVVAAHPDDESLGAAGLMSRVLALPADQRPTVEVVLLTSGERSHPESPTHSTEVLSARRLEESRAAVLALGDGAEAVGIECWDVGDGQVADDEARWADRLSTLVGDGSRTLLVGPWRHDGHPDHDAAGRICAAVAHRTGARLLEYPIWFWHHAEPQDAPWVDLRRLPMDPVTSAAKHRAVECHTSQVRPLSDAPGDETLLLPGMLAHFLGEQEVFVEEPAHDDTLDALHREVAEPWGADTRWYEERKRALTMAMLPDRRHGRALEVGCSTGVLTRELAGRCAEVLAVDASAAAVTAARRRTEDLDHVEVQHRLLPEDWPDGRYDLVVVSELGYFLSPVDLEELVRQVANGLASDGVVLLAHWRHPVQGWPLDCAAVHRAFESLSDWSRLAEYRDRDVEMLLLGPQSRMPEPHA